MNISKELLLDAKKALDSARADFPDDLFLLSKDDLIHMLTCGSMTREEALDFIDDYTLDMEDEE